MTVDSASRPIGAISEKKSERGRANRLRRAAVHPSPPNAVAGFPARRKIVERCRQFSGAGFGSRPRKKKEGGAWKWAITVDSANRAIGARIVDKGVENQAAKKRKKVRERQVLEKNRRKMSSILRGGIRIPPQEEVRRRSLEVGDESIHWRLARGAIPEKNGGEKKGSSLLYADPQQNLFSLVHGAGSTKAVQQSSSGRKL